MFADGAIALAAGVEPLADGAFAFGDPGGELVGAWWAFDDRADVHFDFVIREPAEGFFARAAARIRKDQRLFVAAAARHLDR